ncbi:MULTISPECIES: AAA family ATPase [unclassified Rubrivivax]|uniref:AAA family ATPase n=1 Tax=unclassified Rubrivivax TaxID=2649762 RepID=UPI001E5C65CA|nr:MULTISPECIES: AAA family ATPase [unclassified Rubrivivax]MCC9595435.1 AAA family ATPase [Rubrivivax sp. JA1055]MCC9647058.1 AAA family ATPase [Rubrivivax sp. JA1029]
MPSATTTAAPGGYLLQRQAAAEAELAQAVQRSEALWSEVQKHYPACEEAVARMRSTVEAESASLAHELLMDARKAARGDAFKLRALVADHRLRLLLWFVLLTVTPWLTMSVIGFVVGMPAFGYFRFLSHLFTLDISIFGFLVLSLSSAAVYGILVRWGIVRKGDRDSQAAREAVLEFGRRPLSLMHFGERESGDSRYPYNATRAPWPDQDILTNWRIDPAHGKLFGANLITWHQAGSETEPHSLLRLPFGDAPAAVIALGDSSSKPQWKWQEQLALRASGALSAQVGAIGTLASHAAAWSQERSRVAALRQRIKTLQDVRQNWNDVAIDEPTLDQVLKLVDLFVSGRKPSPKGILLYGPPGTGKTLIARKLAKHASCHFESVNIADLKGQHIGHTAPQVKAVWQRCREKAPTLLFVDECESAFARRGGVDTDSFGNELVQTFLSEWDGFNQASGQVLVIGATNRRDILDDAVVSRFTAMVEIGLPNASSRRRILSHELQQAGMAVELPDNVINESSGMSGRDLHTLVAAVVAEHLGNTITPDNLLAAIRQVRGKGSTRVEEKGWDDIVLPAAAREEFESLGAELRDAEQMTKLGVPPPEGILLYGPPGTGKTQIARVLASQSGLSFVGASTADMKANYLGQSGSKVKALFERARSQAPCILFIDEIDIVAPARDGGGNDALTQEIVGQLLQELDGVASKKGQVFLLCASNHPDRIDSALLSRLDRKIRIELPDQGAREAILQLELRGKPVGFDVAATAAAIAAQTAGWSGRDLHKLISRATRKAVVRARRNGGDASQTSLAMEDLEASLDERDAT